MSDEPKQSASESTVPAPPAGGLLSLPLGILTALFGPLTLQNLYQWVRVIVIAVGLTLFIRWCMFEPYKIPSGSMIPTLDIGDRILVNKWRYGLRIPFTKTRLWYGEAPKRWEIVVFKNVADDAEHPVLVKRIVALPGERVQIENGRIWIDGTPLDLPPDMPQITYTVPRYSGMPYGIRPEDEFSVVPPGHYLVLGDNSAQSNDGRAFGWLPNENMLGPVVAIWWPIPRMRDFSGFTRSWWWRGGLGLLGLYMLVTVFVARSWKVHGTGSGGVLRSGDRIVVNLLAYGPSIPFLGIRPVMFRPPRPGELVVYSGPSDDSGQLHIGRVSALPGDRVTSPSNGSHADGQPRPSDTSSKDELIVPDRHVYIVSDETDDAIDSRQLGFIPMDAITGPITRIVWPPARWGRVTR